MKQVLAWIGGTILFLGALFLLAYFGLGMRRYFEPKHAEVDRQVFEQTPSFVHGKAQYILRLRLEYEDENTSEAKRESLRRLIKSEASQVDVTLLPLDLQSFLSSL